VSATQLRQDPESGDNWAVSYIDVYTDEVFKTRHLGNADVAAEASVETLLERSCDSDLAEAEAGGTRYRAMATSLDFEGICSGVPLMFCGMWPRHAG
jgi:hypothetical protein